MFDKAENHRFLFRTSLGGFVQHDCHKLVSAKTSTEAWYNRSLSLSMEELDRLIRMENNA